MIRRAAPILLCLLLAAPFPERASEEEIPLPGKWSTVYVWLLAASPDYSPGPPEEEKSLTAAHIQYQLRLQRDGQAIAAGGFGPGSDGSLVGMTLLRGDSLEQARKVAEADPAVKAGRLTSEVREWWIPAGRLPPRPSGAGAAD